MGAKYVLGVIIATFGLAGSLGADARAAAPWERLLTLNRVEADPEKAYNLGEENGPWMIMASSFSGDGAHQQARELVLELRQRYKLPAYYYRKRFDLDGDAGGRGIDRYGEPIKWKHRRGSEFEEIAVLVGDYPSVDDPEAKRTAQRLKYSRPKCLGIKRGKQTNQSLAGLRRIQKALLKQGSAKKEKGPMGHAFITPNPLLPKDKIVPKGLDPLVIKMNKAIKHGLLDCPGKFTVQVAHFTGKVIVKQSVIQEIESGKRKLKSSRLDEAAEKAHKLTDALRLKGYEAYEFHDRYASIVTVGSFGSVGVPRRDGKIEIQPQIHRIMETFKGKQPAGGGQIMAQVVVGIPLDLQPRIVHVPKAPIATTLSRNKVGLW